MLGRLPSFFPSWRLFNRNHKLDLGHLLFHIKSQGGSRNRLLFSQKGDRQRALSFSPRTSDRRAFSIDE